MGHVSQRSDAVSMARVIRVVAVIVITGSALVLLSWAYAFGRCEGWKGTGTCPRVPFWDWETFWIAFWAGVFPTIALRVERRRLLRTTAEALGVGVALGSIVVVGTGF